MNYNNTPETPTQQPNCATYNRTDYPSPDELLRHLLNNKQKQAIDINALSVNGLIVKDSMNEYLNKKDHVSSSSLKEVLKTPLHFWHYQNQTFKKQARRCFELGTFAHMAFLEPEMFDKCIITPDFKLNSIDGVERAIKFWEGKIAAQSNYASILSTAKALVEEENFSLDKIDGKRKYIEWLSFGSGYTAVDEEQKKMVDLLKQHYHTYGGGILPMLMQGAEKEYSVYTTDEATGLPVKIRPDAFNISENCGVDCIISFKTTSAPNLKKFIYDTTKYEYELTEGMYQEVMSRCTGRRFNATITVMLQTVPPYLPAVFWWSADDLASGKFKYRRCLQIVKECQTKKSFTGFDAQAKTGYCGLIELDQKQPLPKSFP